MNLQRATLVARHPALCGAGLAVVLAAGLHAWRPAQAQNTYTIYTAGGRDALPFEAGDTHTVALDALAQQFGFSVREDLLVEGVVGGLTITTTGERILLIPGQSFAQVSGEVRSLSGRVEGERGAWRVPIDFLSRALGPATGVPMEVRRNSRLIVVGEIRVPVITGRVERVGDLGRLVLDIRPATAHTVSQAGPRLVVQFEAEALDLGAIAGAAPEYVQSIAVDGAALTITLGPDAASVEADEDADDSRLSIDLAPADAAPIGVTPPATPADPPVVDIATPGVIRTVIIDPGHGGTDAGARGPGGLLEKDVTLQVARQLKAAIESRIGLRVVLTRDEDLAVAPERRSALANNNKADLFISLHANGSFSPAVAGAEVVSLGPEAYAARAPSVAAGGSRVTFLGGDSRLVEAVPWDLAQLPHADRSGALGDILVRHLLQQGVPLYQPAPDRRAIRVLVGTNMPAVQIEMGFLTNPEEERALRSGDRRTAVVEAIVATIAEVRRGIPVGPPDDGGSR